MAQIIPNKKYEGYPCSYVGAGCAYEDIKKKEFKEELPESLSKEGYLSLKNEEEFLKTFFNIKKKRYYKRTERPYLIDFLRENKGPCCICVYGHFVYANGEDYWSYFDNDYSKVVNVWYLEDKAV